MNNNEEDDREEWAVDSTDPSPPPRADGQEGPPDDWDGFSWFDYVKREWWYRRDEGKPWRRDPPPVQPRGHQGGEYHFVTAVGEVRSWKSAALHGRGGMADLFAGDLRWPTRHYPAKDKEGQATGRPNPTLCMEALIRVCVATGYLDGAIQHRSVGTWRQDGLPLVHSGNHVFFDGARLKPGTLLGDMLYTVGGNRAPPAHEVDRAGRVVWKPAPESDGLWVMSALDAWHWESEEARELFAGACFNAMLGDAPVWKTHTFVQAPPEAGKTTLLHFAHGLIGGSAGPLLKTFSKSYIEIRYSGMGLAVILDESESDVEVDRIKHLFELIRLLSDDGAMGGRGSMTGKTREFNVHGPVIMAATVRERWRPQDRRRITLLELRPLKARNQVAEPKETIKRLIVEAGERSAALRARAIDRWPLYLANFKVAHAAIMALGGTSGDGDQLGGLIAGWWTLTRDAEADDDLVADVKRFLPFVRSLVEIDDGDDAATDCFNYLLGAPVHGIWRGGEMWTVGQTIARARTDEVDGSSARAALMGKGLRLIPVDRAEPWDKAWLAIANKHNGLDDIFSKVPEWGGEKWNQIMKGLPGVTVKHPGDPENPPVRFAGPQRRALFLPPVLLPDLSDEKP